MVNKVVLNKEAGSYSADIFCLRRDGYEYLKFYREFSERHCKGDEVLEVFVRLCCVVLR